MTKLRQFRLVLFLLFILTLAATAFGQTRQIDEKYQVISNFLREIASSDDDAKIVALIEEYEKKYQDDIYIYSQVHLSKHNRFMDETTDIDEDEIIDILNQIDSRWEKYADENILLSDEYRMWADLKMQKINYLSFPALLKDAKYAKKYYEESIKLDDNNGIAYIQYGVWSLFAPRIGGGGVNKALKNLKKGLSLSSNDYEKYLGYIWLAQVYLKLEKDTDYQQSIANAQKVFGETKFLKFVRKKNQKGKIIGE